ncbi:protein involved in gliding motility GldN [Nonlabens sp. Hel1_33_55]|uniref:type IX secretion system ring protein PorN/GldN n=1 Tax=Nonlabens sp. Hel1_33_55 TaxID=1336802 RepID=UPI000875B2D9|nr:gliding motility protein GldN [Nonlabens sp. Hel1_33_55]SCY24767.1 protein involved in gliding motility GldN [Nonlabens sp. Hel1_33_55]
MMNKLVALIAFLLTVGMVQAQNNILNAKSFDEIGEKTLEQVINDNDTPLPYGFVGDRDILWERNVWEKIDLDEKVNFPLYYPVDTNFVGSERRSLFHVITKAAAEGKVKLYADSYGNTERNFQDLGSSLKRVDTSDVGIQRFNETGSVPAEFITTTTINANMVSQYHIRGVWYFDSRQAEMKYRMIALAPVTPDVNFLDDPQGVELFWVFYPDMRDILHEAKVFNERNSARPFTFDHLLNSRHFNATIYKIDNVQGDREVESYITNNSMMQLLESDRLKETIRNFELDMWNY